MTDISHSHTRNNKRKEKKNGKNLLDCNGEKKVDILIWVLRQENHTRMTSKKTKRQRQIDIS